MGSEMCIRDRLIYQPIEPVDEKLLKKIAENTGGKFYKSVDEKTLKEIYRTLSKNIKREKELTDIWKPFVVLATILLLIEFYLRYTRFIMVP